MTEHADAIVVGMGVGGEAVATELAEAGLDVVGIENRLVGGECPYWACVPTKMMVRATDALAEARRVPDLAGAATVTADWAPVARRIRQEATHYWDDKEAVERFESKGGRFIRGTARFTGPKTVEMGTTQITASRAVVIATGSGPAVPPIDGLAGVPYWTNRHAVEATDVPASLIVIGAGAVGAEFAQVFARFGSRVSVVETADRLLPLEEPEAGNLLAEVFAREGIEVEIGARIDAVGHDQAGFSVRLNDGRMLMSEQLLVATGRRSDLVALGVGSAGLDEAARFVVVDENLRATDGIWAVGDITGKGAFTHVATYQARIAAADILGRPHEPADYRALPRVTFTDPEVGAVGMTESQARQAHIAVRTASTPLPSSTRGWIHKVGNDGLIKLVADTDRGVLVGATSMGPAGGEVLGALAVAVHAAVPVEVLARMIYAYPTFHRAIEDALNKLS
ncbi:MAG: NAD(P)/FAD-dependent oxidoreductase [Acidimicrobiales bacterium]|nr:NAD(P)/FAD-dependent oxidoreductase [Acidimicrobiales bacterium]